MPGSDTGGWTYTPPSYAQASKDADKFAKQGAAERLREGYNDMFDRVMANGNPGQQELIRRVESIYISYGLDISLRATLPSFDEFLGTMSLAIKTQPVEGLLSIGFSYYLVAAAEAWQSRGLFMIGVLIGAPIARDIDRHRRRRFKNREEEERARRRTKEGDDPDNTYRRYQNNQWEISNKRTAALEEQRALKGEMGREAQKAAERRAVRRRLLKFLIPGR